MAQPAGDGAQAHLDVRGSTLGFQGAITDRATGSVVLGPRRYDPTTARFSTADSYVAGGLDLGLALDPLTGNRYLFAGANPVAFFDDGHSPRREGGLSRCSPDGEGGYRRAPAAKESEPWRDRRLRRRALRLRHRKRPQEGRQRSEL